MASPTNHMKESYPRFQVIHIGDMVKQDVHLQQQHGANISVYLRNISTILLILWHK